MKFLVVDDSVLSRRTLRQSLEQLGHEVTEASDGVAGLERYFLDKPDYVMLDLVMPGMNGFEVLKTLRALDPDSRVIICTADIQQSTRETILRDGAFGLMNKPVTAEKITTLLTSKSSLRS